MNKLGLHSLCWAGSWSPEDAEMAISNTAKLGYDIIEIPALSPDEIDTKLTKSLLEKYNLSATMSLGLSDDMDISSNDVEKTQRGEAHLMKIIDIASEIGVSHVCGILYSGFQKYFYPATEEGINNSIAVIKRVCQYAAKHNIIVGMEVVNRYETNVLNTAAQGVEFCKKVDEPNCKVHLDVYHMNIEEADVYNAIVETGDYLGYFHTGESHRGYLGTGSINYQKVFRALQKIDYQGPITFESFSSAIVNQPLSGILGIWRNLWDDSEDLCRHAREFTLAQLKAAQKNSLI